MNLRVNVNDANSSLPSLQLPRVRIIYNTIVSEGDLEELSLCESSDEFFATLHLKVHHDSLYSKVHKQRYESENGNSYLQIKQETCSSLTALDPSVSEGDTLSFEAVLSVGLILICAPVKMHLLLVTMLVDELGDYAHVSSDSCTCVINSGSNYLVLDGCIRKNIKVSNEKSQQTYQFGSCELFHEQIISTVTVEGTISLLTQRSKSTTHQSTANSNAYLHNRSTRHATSIDASTQRNSLAMGLMARWCKC